MLTDHYEHDLGRLLRTGLAPSPGWDARAMAAMADTRPRRHPNLLTYVIVAALVLLLAAGVFAAVRYFFVEGTFMFLEDDMGKPPAAPREVTRFFSGDLQWRESSLYGGPRTIDLSPDGHQVCFHRNDGWPPQRSDLFVANRDGSDEVNLTAALGGVNCSPRWSPDASMIGFSHADPAEGQRPCRAGFHAWVITADGFDAWPILPASRGENRFYAWSPDGARVVLWEVSRGGGTLFHTNTDSGPGGHRHSDPWIAQPGVWYHIALVREGSLWTFYLDGVPNGTVADSTTIEDAAAPLTIGWAEGGSAFRGSIDEVAIYNRALTADEIQHHHQNGLAGHGYIGAGTPLSDMVAYWTFDDGTAVDSAGSNDGTVYGAIPGAGPVDGALHFDGSSCVSVPDSDLWTFAGDFSIKLWAKFDTFGIWWEKAFIGHDEGSGSRSKWIFTYDSGASTNAPGYSGRGSITTDIWGQDIRPLPNVGINAAWSPDGTKIASIPHVPDHLDGDPGTWNQLLLTAADGSDPEVLVEQFVSEEDIQAHLFAQVGGVAPMSSMFRSGVVAWAGPK
ncbi:MAG: LamG-like jellyroll fold domain-containing protein, partial [Planctomycetota bacterium]